MIGKFEKKYGTGHIEKNIGMQKFTAPSAKLLVVDDDEMNRAVMKGLLKRTLIQSDFADSGKKCLEKIAEKEYDVILLDHMMPGMDGIETLAEMKERYPDYRAKVVALTANAISGAKQMYLESGFDDYMTKPIDGDTLEKKLMEYIPAEKLDKNRKEEEKGYSAVKEEKKDAVSLAELKKWKEAIPELDVLLGLEYSIGDKEFYLEMVRMFAGQSKLPKLNIMNILQSVIRRLWNITKNVLINFKIIFPKSDGTVFTVPSDSFYGKLLLYSIR